METSGVINGQRGPFHGGHPHLFSCYIAKHYAPKRRVAKFFSHFFAVTNHVVIFTSLCIWTVVLWILKSRIIGSHLQTALWNGCTDLKFRQKLLVSLLLLADTIKMNWFYYSDVCGGNWHPGFCKWHFPLLLVLNTVSYVY